MTLTEHFGLLATYNQWMNSKVYEAAGHLSDSELSKDRGAFFGSIIGTLNHILVADTIWLQRFATHPSCQTSLIEVARLPGPKSLDQVLFEDLGSLSEHRTWLDGQITNWIEALNDKDLGFVLDYKNIQGVSSSKTYSSLVLHFFNHQTHHRGQVTTLLSQAGQDVGVTDLLALIPDESDG